MNPQQHLHFVTGRLAEQIVRSTVEQVAEENGFTYSIGVMPITVAALMTAKWLRRHLVPPPETTQLVLPGYLKDECDALQQHYQLPVLCGPKNIRDLPTMFGKSVERSPSYGAYSIEILAEINHANRLSVPVLMEQARALVAAGANVIDLGCTPGQRWDEVGIAVREMVAEGIRVSIDSFDGSEVSQACRAGAELVLSVNGSNVEQAADWGTEVVVIPDTPEDYESLVRTANELTNAGVPLRLDPILEPIGLGFSQSLMRYARCRQDFPDVPIMMGIGNITELTDCDSAGINKLLLGFCEELQINSVLTTQVINWARTSVRECDLARRLVHYATQQRTPPKNLEPNLVLLRDGRVTEYSEATIATIADTIRDNNFRIFTSGGEVHVVAARLHVRGVDPYEVMQQVLASHLGPTIDSGHAFYLGYELCKAVQAITLGKQYEQDESLNWGFLTRHEQHVRLKKSGKRTVE